MYYIREDFIRNFNVQRAELAGLTARLEDTSETPDLNESDLKVSLINNNSPAKIREFYYF